MNDEPRLRVIFYRTTGGNEPVREWLKALPAEDRKIIGDDLKTAQYGSTAAAITAAGMSGDDERDAFG